MLTESRYWVVSPNVQNRVGIDLFLERIRVESVALMGWDGETEGGKTFKEDVQVGDLIIIA